MTRKWNAAIATVAMTVSAPALAHGYEPNSPKNVDQQIAEKCKGSASQRAACETQIRQSYKRYVERTQAAAPRPRTR